ncbi:MAG: GNAT family N-acetyltransferase [Clostridia bacterium]|nr:GNAT family N-acetyltransferase [Clostridia bacterium]
MRYEQRVVLKNGTEVLLRNGVASDADAVFENFNLTHAETDYLLSYPDENSYDPALEARFLEEKTNSPNEIEIVAFVDGAVAGTAGIEAVGTKHKVRHRAELGISVSRAYWGIGLGRALLNACIRCARDAGYVQLELSVVAENKRAVSLYRSVGFEEFGRNPRGFNSRTGGFQEVILMLLKL